MAELINLIKESFDLSVRIRRLKNIDRAIKKRSKIYEAYRRQNYIIVDLVNKYNELYPDSKFNLKGK
jgi:hypothetical protein